MPVGLLLVLAVAAVQTPEAAPTLDAYLKAHAEEAGLVVGAEGVKPRAEGAGLARYGRKRVLVGGLPTVVPATMVRFDENPTEPPNLYDGLPRDAKVLYLMSLLNAGEWRKAAGEGIGLSDVRGEARAVLASLLPHRLAWDEVRVSADHGWGPIVGHGGLDEKESMGVRLRIEQTLQIDIPLAGDGGVTGGLPSTELGTPGTTVKMRNTQSEDYDPSSYGVVLRTDVPNAPKKGDLDTSGMNAAASLPSPTTVGEALSRLGRAAGREILADVRVRNLSVLLPGGPQRTGDLLDGIARAVCGTYRRVDGAFLLVSDLTGQGARALRWGLWKGEIDAEVERRKGEWTASLAASGLAQRADFPDDPLLGASPALRRHLEEGDRDPVNIHWFSPDELSPEQRSFVDRTVAHIKDRSVVPGRVSVISSLRYRLVLPDGTPLQVEGYLGVSRSFMPHERRALGPDPAVPKAANPGEAVRPLGVAPTSPDEARRASATARAYGFTELWVETERADVLQAAIAGGLPVRLLARPWALGTPRRDSDRTALGDTGRAVAHWQATDPLWTAYAAERRLQVYPRLGPRGFDDDLMSPADPQWPARVALVGRLARTAGLAGVVLIDTTPRGYEARDPGINSAGYGRLLQESWALGYDERMRLAFFRQEGYDPIDLWTEALPDGVEVDTPTFRKYPAPPARLVREAYDRWTTFRGTLNLQALQSLRSAVGDIPVLADVHRLAGWQPPSGDVTLAPWALGSNPPFYDDQFVPETPGAVGMISAPEPRQKAALEEFVTAVRVLAPKPKSSLALDLTHVPASQWDETLDRSLNRR